MTLKMKRAVLKNSFLSLRSYCNERTITRDSIVTQIRYFRAIRFGNGKILDVSHPLQLFPEPFGKALRSIVAHRKLEHCKHQAPSAIDRKGHLGIVPHRSCIRCDFLRKKFLININSDSDN